MKTFITAAIAVAASAALSLPAQALTTATVTVTAFGATSGSADITGALNAQTSFLSGTTIVGHESFETFPNGALDPVKSTQVGDFTSLGAGTCGSACTGASGSSIDELAIFPAGTVNGKNVSTGSRFAVDGSKWLDSNDTLGIEWTIPGSAPALGSFDRISFMTTDIDDVGAVTFNLAGITTNLVYDLPTELGTNRRPNGELLLWNIAFSALITDENLKLGIDGGDGFGVDNIKIAVTPLPAGLWLLIGGVSGLGVLRRMKRRAA